MFDTFSIATPLLRFIEMHYGTIAGFIVPLTGLPVDLTYMAKMHFWQFKHFSFSCSIKEEERVVFCFLL